MSTPAAGHRVALVTLGCARNDVDSEELAGRLTADGWDLVEDPDDADTVVVNTCGFVDAAKKDSIDTLLAAADPTSDGRTRHVVAVGCLAERYGDQLAEQLPETDAVLSFDDYADIGDRLRSVISGATLHPHTPRDRRKLLPVSPVDRASARDAAPVVVDDELSAPGAPPSGPRVLRRRLEGGPTAPLKLASGCDRRCTFCAIPAFRGSFVSRRPHEILDEARWLAEQGVRELFLVSENSTSYGKDLGDLRLLEKILPEIAAVEGIARVRVSYLQPAEIRPGLIEAIATTPGVTPYFDLSFQHASPTVLRRMRRFGGTTEFLGLLDQIRTFAPAAGARSNVIVGFPGETEADVEELEIFLTQARLDVVGVFGYSDEDGTEAATFTDQLPESVVRERVERITTLVDELCAQRAEDRINEVLDVLIESIDGDTAEGRANHQGPEVDGSTHLVNTPELRVGDIAKAVVIGTDGVDLIAEVTGPVRRVR